MSLSSHREALLAAAVEPRVPSFCGLSHGDLGLPREQRPAGRARFGCTAAAVNATVPAKRQPPQCDWCVLKLAHPLLPRNAVAIARRPRHCWQHWQPSRCPRPAHLGAVRPLGGLIRVRVVDAAI